MKGNEKEIFIGELKHHINSNASTPPRPKHMKRMRTGIKISPIGLILLCSMIAIGMLTGMLYSMFVVNMEGDVTLTGTMKPLFSFDGTDFMTPSLNLTADLTALNSSETKTFTHYIVNKDAGGWLVEVDLGDLSFYNTPEHDFYGLNITCGNWKVDGIPTTSHVVRPLENLSFDLVWSLHHEFVTTTTPFPSEISITLTRTNEPPLVVNDTIVVSYHGTNSINVTANDYDFEGDHITIVGFQADPHSQINLVKLDDHRMQVTNDYGSSGSFFVWIDVSDGLHTVREYLSITLQS